jgi:M6 family metalloprotease-like protein
MHCTRQKVTLALWIVLITFAPILSPALLAQSLTDFGYRRMTVGGTPASGGRPLVVVLQDFAGRTALNHPASYYDHLIFGTGSNPGNYSVNEFYRENSHGRFFWTRAGAGTYGPFNYAASQYDTETASKKTLKRLWLALQSLAGEGFDFTQYDANQDGKVTRNELSVLVVDNGTTTSAGNRPPDPGCYKYTNSSGKSVDVCLDAIANVGHRGSFTSFAHELSHQLGTIEMYGTSGNENASYTLMGATIFPGLDDMRTFHLDPWHKMMLGWIEPKIRSLDSDGGATLQAAQLANADSALILYSPAKGTKEFYLLEFRTTARAGGARYDANLNGAGIVAGPQFGLVIWHIKTKGLGGEDVNSDVEILDAYDVAGAKMISAFMNGAPNFARGQGGPWIMSGPIAGGVVPYWLQWLDGLGRPVKVRVGPITNSGDDLRVSWGVFADPPAPISRKILAYNESGGSAATGIINSSDASFTTLQHYTGTLSPWTHVVGGATDVLFYNSRDGNAAIGQVDAAGNFTTTRNLGVGYFVPSWTHIVFHKGYYLFYNSGTGAAVIGNFQSEGFRPYNSVLSFSTGWTNIVSTENGLLFYNATSGSGAVGDWTFVKSGTGFGTISKVNFNRLQLYGPGSFLTGWTHVVNTSNGVLFYCSANGRQVMTELQSDGSVTTRGGTEQTIAMGWSSIVSANDDILFYNSTSGDVAIGGIRKPSVFGTYLGGPGPLTSGSLVIRRALPAYFSPAWSSVVTTVDPPKV